VLKPAYVLKQLMWNPITYLSSVHVLTQPLCSYVVAILQVHHERLKQDAVLIDHLRLRTQVTKGQIASAMEELSRQESMEEDHSQVGCAFLSPGRCPSSHSRATFFSPFHVRAHTLVYATIALNPIAPPTHTHTHTHAHIHTHTRARRWITTS
jgi:hypothetical protein